MFHSKYKLHIISLLLIGAGVILVAAPFAHAQGAIPGSEQTVWDFISKRAGVINLWRLSLGLVDLLVVAGLIIAAFSNIFRINIKSYEIKQILPGLIIGVILANLSFFIMRLFLDGASVFTQSIGELTAQQIGITNSFPAGAQILGGLTGEMLKSLFTLPSQLAGVTVTAGGFTAFIATPGLGIVALIGILLLIAIPITLIIFYLIVLFLLYIRNYILVVMFILSPLAFFALGYPPFRSWWQKWWGTFWKWLLMAPVAHLLLAFAMIFLHYANKDVGLAFSGSGNRGLTDYLFVNGVAIGLIYFASRIPFMWGSFFGIADMKQWAKAGKWLGTKGTNSAWDLGSKGMAVNRTQKKNNFGLEPDKLKEKMEELKKQGKVGKEAEDILRKRQIAELEGKYKAKAPARQFRGGVNVVKSWAERGEKDDEYLTKSKDNPTYTKMKRWLDKKGYLEDLDEYHKGLVEDNENLYELGEEVNKGRKMLLEAGVDPAEVIRLMTMGANAPKTGKFIMENAAFDGKDEGDVMKWLRHLKQLRKANTSLAKNRGDARKKWEGFIADHKMDKETIYDKKTKTDVEREQNLKYFDADWDVDSDPDADSGGGTGGGPGPAGSGPTGSGSGSSGSGSSGGGKGKGKGKGRPSGGGGSTPFAPGSNPVPVVIQEVAQNAYKYARVSNDEREILSGFPSKSRSHYDSTYTEPAEQALEQALTSTLTGPRAHDVMAKIRARAMDPGAQSLGTLAEYGPEFQTLVANEKTALNQQMHSYGRAVRGHELMVYNSIDPDSNILSAEHLANNLSTGPSSNSQAETQKLQNMDHDLKALEDILNREPTSVTLKQVHSGLSQHNIPVLDIPTPGTTGDNFEVHEALADRVEAARAAVELKQSAVVNQSTVREVVTNRQDTDVALKDIMKAIDTTQRELGQSLADSVADNVAAQTQQTIKSLMLSAPELNKRDKPVVIDAATVSQVADQIVKPITAQLAAQQKAQQGTHAMDLLGNKSEANELRTIIRTAMQEAARQPQPVVEAATETAQVAPAEVAPTEAAPQPAAAPAPVGEVAAPAPEAAPTPAAPAPEPPAGTA